MLTTMQLRSVKSIMFSICFGWIMAFFTALRAAENTESLPFIFWHYNHVSCGGDNPFRNMKLQLPANLNCYNETTMHQKGVITQVLSDWRTCVWLHQPRSSASPNGNTSLLILPQILTFPICCFCTAAILTGTTWRVLINHDYGGLRATASLCSLWINSIPILPANTFGEMIQVVS